MKLGENGLCPIIQEGKFIQYKFLYVVTKKIRFARHLTFVFLMYDALNRRRAGLGYFLLTKTRFWEQTHSEVDALTMEELNDAANKIQATGKCTNPAIPKLERLVQIVAGQTPHLFAR